jgi:hypothetical protein
MLCVRREDGGFAVAAFADDLDVFVRAQEADESAAGERFVVDDEGADHFCAGFRTGSGLRAGAGSACGEGILTRAETPRGWMGRSSSVAASP